MRTLPGQWLQSLAARVCSADVMERIIEPTIADVRHEYEAARRDRRVWRGRWVLFSGRLALVKVLAIQVCAAADATEADARRQAIAGGLLAMAAVTALFHGALLASVWGSATTNRLALAAYAIPQALPVGIACGFVLGLLYGGAEAISRRAASITLVAAAAVIIAILSFATISWIVPASNYAFRVAVTGQDVPRGINELTSSDLRERLASDVAEPVRVAGSRGDRRFVAIMLSTRTAFAFAAPFLALIALPMLSWRRHTVRLAAGVILCVLYLGYFFWLTDETAAGRLVALSPAAAAWLPNYLIAVVAITWMAQARWFRARSVPDRRG